MLFGRASCAARTMMRSAPRLRVQRVSSVARLTSQVFLLEQRCALIRTSHMLSVAALTGDKQLMGRLSPGSSGNLDLELDEEDRSVFIVSVGVTF